jgi:Thioredoxin
MQGGNKIGGGKTNQVLSQLTTSYVAEKASEHLQNLISESADLPDSQNEESELEQIRNKRLEEIKNNRREIQENISLRGHGEYTEVTQDEFLPKVTASKQVVCHFFHKDFQRCKILDHHLRILARTHPETKFISINSEKSPFFIERLAIKTLPTLLLFRDGINFERILGFEGISNKDSFPTSSLAKRLLKSNMITPISKEESDSDDD